MPPLTQTMGPWIRYPKNQKYETQLSFDKKVMSELIAQLPAVARFKQNFHYSVTNWLPFYWHGFKQTTRYTYVLDNLTNMDKIWFGLGANIRGDIKKAKRRFALQVSQNNNVDKFLKVNRMTFSRQGEQLPYSSALIMRLDKACQQRNCRKIFFAQDAEKRIHAAIYLIWDNHSAYYLMGGADPKLRNSGATSLLLWKAIKFASTIVPRFDFEGSMIESIERFFRAFGGKHQPFSVITKDAHPLVFNCLFSAKRFLIKRHRFNNRHH